MVSELQSDHHRIVYPGFRVCPFYHSVQNHPGWCLRDLYRVSLPLRNTRWPHGTVLRHPINADRIKIIGSEVWFQDSIGVFTDGNFHRFVNLSMGIQTPGGGGCSSFIHLRWSIVRPWLRFDIQVESHLRRYGHHCHDHQ